MGGDVTTIALLWGAAWLGLLTAVSPCPLATNLAATAYLSRRVDSRRKAVMGTLWYTVGRAAAYVAVAMLLALGLASAPGLSHGLQKWLPPLLGPLLVLASMVLLGLLRLPFAPSAASQESAERWAKRGWFGDVVLGFLFALSFCPVSAALFFGSLLPLALKSGSVIAPVAIYGVATAAPVAAFSLLMIFSTRVASRLAGGLTRWQPVMMKVTGVLLMLAGLYLMVRHTFGVEIF